MLGELLLRPVQVPDESLEGVQLPEEVLRRPGAVAAIKPKTHTHTRRRTHRNTHTGQKIKVTKLERDGGRGVRGVLWQVQRRMLFLHT